jgi:hypothetical protein
LVDEFATTLGTVHALVDCIAALSGADARSLQEPSPTAQFQALIAELDRTLDFFRLQPRRTIREGAA